MPLGGRKVWDHYHPMMEGAAWPLTCLWKRENIRKNLELLPVPKRAQESWKGTLHHGRK